MLEKTILAPLFCPNIFIICELSLITSDSFFEECFLCNKLIKNTILG